MPLATSPPWVDTNWGSEENYLEGYPFPLVSKRVEVFDISKVYSIWVQDMSVDNYYHPRGTNVEVFDISKVYSIWELENIDRLYGYVSPKGHDIYRIGAFANTSNLESIYIPTTVLFIGACSFSNSAIESVTISPDCYYYSSTFPDTCIVSYFTVSNLTITTLPKTQYYLNESIDFSGSVISATINGVGESTTRNIVRNYSYSGYNTSVSGTQTVTLTFSNATTTFNITVLPYDKTMWNYVQDASDGASTSSTKSISAVDSCLLVVAAMHRKTVSIEGDGWTQLVVSEIIDPSVTDQCITIWYKSVSAGDYSITVNQSESDNLSVKAICLYQASSLSVVDNDLISTVPYTPTAKTDKRRLYVLSSLSIPSGSQNAITISGYTGIDIQSAQELRFSLFYDYQPSVSVTPSFSYYDSANYVADTMNSITIDIS